MAINLEDVKKGIVLHDIGILVALFWQHEESEDK